MNKPQWLVFWIILLAGVPPVSAMNNYDDPRVVLSYMDSSLEPARDILRLTTEVSDNQELVFQVKMRGEGAKSGARDYVLLQVWQDRSHLWLVPLRLD